jgi:hypothetical protein
MIGQSRVQHAAHAMIRGEPFGKARIIACAAYCTRDWPIIRGTNWRLNRWTARLARC